MEKTFKLNKKGNIELSQKEFKKCLDDNFWLGYARGVASAYNKHTSYDNYTTDTPCSYIYNTPIRIYDSNSLLQTCCTQRREVI